MPQTYTTPVTPNRAAMRQALGWVPPREAEGGAGVTIDGGPNPVIGAETLSGVAGTYGDDVTVPQLTFDDTGRLTGETDVPITFPAPPPVGVGSVTFGVGAPPAIPPGPVPADGDLYFDTTLAVYVGYVGNGGVWNQF